MEALTSHLESSILLCISEYGEGVWLWAWTPSFWGLPVPLGSRYVAVIRDMPVPGDVDASSIQSRGLCWVIVATGFGCPYKLFQSWIYCAKENSFIFSCRSNLLGRFVVTDMVSTCRPVQTAVTQCIVVLSSKEIWIWALTNLLIHPYSVIFGGFPSTVYFHGIFHWGFSFSSPPLGRTQK